MGAHLARSRVHSVADDAAAWSDCRQSARVGDKADAPRVRAGLARSQPGAEPRALHDHVAQEPRLPVRDGADVLVLVESLLLHAQAVLRNPARRGLLRRAAPLNEVVLVHMVALAGEHVPQHVDLQVVALGPLDHQLLVAEDDVLVVPGWRTQPGLWWRAPARLASRGTWGSTARQKGGGHRHPALCASNTHACILCKEKAMTPATHRRPVSISRLAWSRSMSRNVRVDVGARAITAASSSARACRVGRAFVTVAMPLKKREKRQGEVSLLSVADEARTWAPEEALGARLPAALCAAAAAGDERPRQEHHRGGESHHRGSA